MPMPIVLTTDSSADLPEPIRQEFDIHYMRIPITLEGNTGLDCADIFPSDIFEAFSARGALPKTAAPAPAQYQEFFESFTAQGAVVVHIAVNGKFSSCHDFACVGANEAKGEVHVVDSRNFCVGQGMLCIRAAQLRNEGLSAPEIATQLEAERKKVRAVYYLHGLDFLSKSGRCPSLVAMGATLLNLHPTITIDDGVVVIGKKYRGKKAPEAWLRDCAGKMIAQCDPEMLCAFAFTPDIPPERHEPLKNLAHELLSPQFKRMEFINELGCVVISHVGGNCFALVGMEK